MAGAKKAAKGGRAKAEPGKMEVLILAAGEGTRMRPLTANTPKPLLPVAGRPFLEHTILALKSAGIKDIKILLGWKDEKIRDHFENGQKLGVWIDYLEQKERLGTAHAIGMADGAIKGNFLSINGDVVVTREMVRGIIDCHKSAGGGIMAVARIKNPSGYGIVQADHDGKVRKIIEKPDRFVGDLVNAGIYLFTPEVFDCIKKTEKSPRGEYEITDTIQMMSGGAGFYTYETKEWIDVTRPWDLLAANEALMRGLKADIKGEVEKFATLKGPVAVGKGSVVKNGAYIVGPCIIGENSEIGPNCLIRPSTFIGDKCKVGNGCEVKNTILMSRSHIPHLNYVGDSIIGERCNLGAGTIVANLRFDDRNINVIQKGRKVDSGRRKLGAIIGDDVQTGINSTINAGTVISEDTRIGPAAYVFGYIAPKSRIY